MTPETHCPTCGRPYGPNVSCLRSQYRELDSYCGKAAKGSQDTLDLTTASATAYLASLDGFGI